MKNAETQLENLGVIVELTSENMHVIPDAALRSSKDSLATIADFDSKDDLRKVLIHQNTVLGVLRVHKSAFDTEHFGFGVGKLVTINVSDKLSDHDVFIAKQLMLQECSSWMSKVDVQCLISRVAYDDVLSVLAHEKTGFRVADILVTFQLDFQSINGQNCSQNYPNVIIRPVQFGEEDILMDIARCAFKHDHFHRDNRFPNHKSDELFSKWIYNCCDGLVDFVLVAVVNDQPSGFIACKFKNTKNEKIGIIELIAVSNSYRRNGLGECLVRESLSVFSELGAKSVSVGTQANNVAAARTYEKIGFKLAQIELTFHKWLEE